MKNIRTIAFCVSISLYSLCSSAQNKDIPINEPNYNKSLLFQGLPDNIPVSMDNIAGLFESQVGRSVSLDLSGAASFRFEGNVISSVSKYENAIQSMVIRSTNYNGATLTVSRITDEKGNISYTGRIISMQHGDLYELKNINNQFVLVKRNFYELVNE